MDGVWKRSITEDLRTDRSAVYVKNGREYNLFCMAQPVGLYGIKVIYTLDHSSELI